MSEETLEAPEEMSEEVLAKRAMMANAFLFFVGAVLFGVVIRTIVLWPGMSDPRNQTFQMMYTAHALAGVGAVLLSIGCAQYAKAKGYSPWLGLLGLICVGFIVVLALHDRNELPGEENSQF